MRKTQCYPDACIYIPHLREPNDLFGAGSNSRAKSMTFVDHISHCTASALPPTICRS